MENQHGPGVVLHACESRSWEGEVRRSRPEDQGQTLPHAKSEFGQPGLHSETLAQTKTN